MTIWRILTCMPLLTVTVCEKNDIDGFTYEPGYRYLLEVQRETLPVDGVMDALLYKYTLVRIIEKTN